MFSGLREEARSKAHSQVQTRLEACGQSLHWNPLYPPSCSEPRSGGAGVPGGHPCSPLWLSRLGAQDSPGRPLVWPRRQGATPPHRQGWSRTPARGPRTQRPPAPPEPRFFDAAGLGPRDGRSEVVVPERGLGTSLRPCSSRSPAPPLGGRRQAPFSFLLCKSPSSLISCFVPVCNGACCYVTSIIKIPPSQRHCLFTRPGEIVPISLLPGRSKSNQPRAGAPRTPGGRGLFTLTGRLSK